MGWKILEDRGVFDKKVSQAGFMPEPVTLCGVALPKGTNPFQASTVPKDHASLTRHHVIPHHLLIAVWNQAVEGGHFDLIKALAFWAGCNTTTDLPGALNADDPAPAPDPERVLMRVAWNPWNIVIGPKMEHRVGDPGNAFDRLQFRELGAFNKSAAPLEGNTAWLENLARQEFNSHIERLYRIYKYMTRYVGTDQPLAGIEVESLTILLRGDLPSQNGHLNDGRKSMLRFGGSILEPALWTNFSFKTIEVHGLPVQPDELRKLEADRRKLEANTRMRTDLQKQKLALLPGKHIGAVSKESKIMQNTVSWGVVSWSAVSYLPEPPLPVPKADSADLWEPGSANLPDDRYLLSRATYDQQSVAEFRADVTRAARRAGSFKGHVKVVGPRGTAGAVHPKHDDVVKATVEALTALRRDGYQFRIARTFLAAAKLEVRFYSQN